MIEYAGRNDRLTAVVCIGCQTNYTPVFTDIRGIENYGSQIWKFAYPLGGDLFIYITYHTCAEDPERVMVMDKNQVSQGYTEACKNGQEMSDTGPESNPYLYHQHIAIWGPASNLVAILSRIPVHLILHDHGSEAQSKSSLQNQPHLYTTGPLYLLACIHDSTFLR